MSAKLVKEIYDSSVPINIAEAVLLTFFFCVIYEMIDALVDGPEHLPEFTGAERRGQGHPAALPLVTVLQEQSKRFLWS